MADFRKWLLAFAAVALLLSIGAPANAQQGVVTPSFTCVANAGAPVTIRAEGLTELVGDIILQCSGGTPTPVGQAVPLTNITVFLNTNITSRLFSGGAQDALMLIDEPYAGNTPAGGTNALNVPGSVIIPNNTAPQQYCAVPLISSCAVTGTGGGVGASGPYSGGSSAHANIFQGQQLSASAVGWVGVPIDAPGTSNTRVIRITNIRANACQLGVSSTLIPTQVVAFISVNGSQLFTINNPQQTVAFIQPGLTVSAGTAGYLQCNSLNAGLLVSSPPANNVVASAITIRATEGFAASFKARAWKEPPTSVTIIGQSTPQLQNVPGFAYNTESAFVSTVTGGAVAGAIGVADTGTRIMYRFNSVGAGVSLFTPAQIALTLGTGTTASGGTASLVTGTDSNGNGGTVSSSSSTAVAVTISGTSATVVYEITSSLPNAVESLRMPLTVAFVSNTANNLPAPGQSTVNVSFAPLSSTGTASSTAPIPRFCDTSTAQNVFRIDACTCDLLFPFVTNQAGFDTGVALANTSLDPFGTTPQAGTTTIYYYGNTTGGGAAPAPQTSQSIPAGSELVFTLSGGGNFGVAATPGFQGYLITISKFQYCHAFAFISDVGSQKVAEGYLAIQLDYAGIERTGQIGEVKAH